MTLADGPLSPLYALAGLAIAVAMYVIIRKLPDGRARRLVSSVDRLSDAATPAYLCAFALALLFVSGVTEGRVGRSLPGGAGVVIPLLYEWRRRGKRKETSVE